MIGAEWASIVVWHGDDLELAVSPHPGGPDLHSVRARPGRLSFAVRIDVTKPSHDHEANPKGLGVAGNRRLSIFG